MASAIAEPVAAGIVPDRDGTAPVTVGPDLDEQPAIPMSKRTDPTFVPLHRMKHPFCSI
jgi:hypothetical protein